MSGHIFAFISCTRVKWEATVAETAEMEGKTEAEVRAEWEGDTDYYADSDSIRLEEPIEECGWVDRWWSPYVLHDSHNDVRPAVDCDESDEGLADEVQDALGWLEGGWVDNGDGTFYAADTYGPYEQPWKYHYALHFVRKSHGSRGWVEQPWHPFKDGHLMWHEGTLTGPHTDYPHEAGTLYDCAACERIMEDES